MEKEVPRVICHSVVKKKIEILNEQGTAKISMTFEGKNISGRPLRKIRHFILSNEKVTKDKLKNAKFNTEDVLPIIKNIQYGKLWRNEITLESSETVKEQAPVNTQYEATLEKEFTEGFSEDKRTETSHDIALRTDKLMFEVIAPKGFYFISPEIDVRDVFNDIEIDDARLSHANRSGFCRRCWGRVMNDRIRKAKGEMKE